MNLDATARTFERACALSVGLVLGLGALSKLVDPHTTAAACEIAMDAPLACMALTAGVAGAEALVAICAFSGAVHGMIVIRTGAVVFAAYSATLIWMLRHGAASRECGCLSVLGDVSSRQALGVDLAMFAQLSAAWIVLDLLRRRRRFPRSRP